MLLSRSKNQKINHILFTKMLKPNIRSLLVNHCRWTSTTISPTQQQPKQPAVPKQQQQADQLEPVQVPTFYPEQVEWLQDRWVRISKPSKNVMQSGTSSLNTWRVEFNSTKRWENDLMGWTSSADPVSNLILNFPNRESAVEYCEKNQLQWYVDEQQERKVRRKSYADNFSWDKRTRISNK